MMTEKGGAGGGRASRRARASGGSWSRNALETFASLNNLPASLGVQLTPRSTGSDSDYLRPPAADRITPSQMAHPWEIPSPLHTGGVPHCSLPGFTLRKPAHMYPVF